MHICGSPLYHTAVLNFVGISIQLGHTVVLMERFDAEEMLRLIDRYKVTHSHMVPTQFTRLLALPEDVRAKYDVSSLRTMIHGAAPCPNEVKRAMLDWWGPVVVEYYAATEGGGATIFADEWLKKPGSVGKAWSYSVIKILDEDGQEVPANQTGLVYMQMGGSSFAYHKAEEKTRESRVGELFTVGDIGYLDDDGYLFLCDRKSDMIISGGVNIYPAEIEGELVMHPAVADVAVFGVPDDQWGEAIKAVIQPAPGVVPSDELTERDPRVRRRAAGEVQAAQGRRVHRRAAARRQRQALQAQAARRQLGRPGESHLSWADVRVAGRGRRRTGARALPRRHRDGDDRLPRRDAREAAARRGAGRGRQDRAGQGGGRRPPAPS